MNLDWLSDIAFRALVYSTREQVVKLCKYYEDKNIPLDIAFIKWELEELYNITEDDLEDFDSSGETITEEE